MSNPHIGGLWNDVRVAPGVRPAGANDPALTIFRDTLRAYAFVNAGMREVFATCQLPHGYKEGTDIKLHIHWGHISGSDNGAVVWQAAYSWANMGSAFGAETVVAATAANVLAADQYEHQVTSIATITGTGKTVSSVLLLRLFRDPANAGDTSTADAYLFELDFHVQADSTGSVNETAKP